MSHRVIFPPAGYFSQETTAMDEPQVRAAAVLAAATFCAPSTETLAVGDVLMFAERFAEYIRDGS